MKKKNNLSEGNKKRAAFKRFSQMGAAGLAVMSMSAFNDVSAKQLPAYGETVLIKEEAVFLATLTHSFYDADEVPWATDYANNYSNIYSNYSNYTENYSNNYSNYCNSATN